MTEVAFLRLSSSAIDPADRDELERLVREDVVPAFERMPGSLSAELGVNVEPSAGGLLEGAFIARWETLDQMQSGVESVEAHGSLARVLPVLRHAPAIRVFEILE